MKQLVLILGLCIGFSISGIAQSTQDAEQLIANLLETMSQNTNLGTVNTQGIEALVDMYNNPININTCTRTQLEDILFLGEDEINKILKYRSEVGQISSKYQLQGIEGFNQNLIEAISLFVNFSSEETYKQKEYVSGQLLLRDSYQLGVDKPDIYQGNMQQMYGRLQLNYSNWQVGATIDKDPGEKLYSSDYGFDFFSGHASYSAEQVDVIVGDYNLNVGQGLAMWTGTNMGKGTDITSTMKRGSIMRPYTSATENGYLRGAAVSAMFNKFTLQAFGSYKNVDSNAEVDDDGNIIVSSMPTTGYHRSPSEIEKRRQTAQITTGAYLHYNSRLLSAYLGSFYNSFDYDSFYVARPYQAYSYPKRQSVVSSAGYKLYLNQLSLFGELSNSDGNSWAFTTGAVFQATSTVSSSILYRNMAVEYYSPYNNSFADGSTQSENGVYLGIKVEPLPWFEASAYSDIFKQKWLSYNADAPYSGNDFMADTYFYPNSDMILNLRYRRRDKSKNNTFYSGTGSSVEPYTSQTLRLNASYEVSTSTQFQFRVEKSFYNDVNGGSDGILSFVNLKNSFFNDDLVTYLRYTVFNIDDYNARIYAYENDVLYGFSTPSFIGDGSKVNFLLRYRLGKSIRLWLRFTHLWQSTLDSAVNEYLKRSQSYMRLQLQYKL